MNNCLLRLEGAIASRQDSGNFEPTHRLNDHFIPGDDGVALRVLRVGLLDAVAIRGAAVGGQRRQADLFQGDLEEI